MPKFAANLTSLFTELPFLERFAAAGRHGFSAVEFLFPYAASKEELSDTLEENNLQQVMFNLPSGEWEAGERGIVCDPGRVSEFRDGVELAVEYAIALRCPQLNCLPGIMPRDNCPLAVRETLASNLRYAATRLERENIRLLIEPINSFDYPGFFLNRSSHALAMIDELDHSNIFLLYDVYHMQLMEGNLASTISENIARIGHVQVADVPGRHEPGTGEINFDFLFRHLDAIGYDGFVGCQYKPLFSTEESLGWLTSHQDEVVGISSGS
jgi:hydroxypyruvate isomerase